MMPDAVTFSFKDETLTILTTGAAIEFDLPIEKVVSCGTGLAILLSVPTGKIENENVFGVSAGGDVIWQIEKIPHVYEDSPYTNIFIQDEALLAINWDGDEVRINYKNGFTDRIGYKK